MSEVILIIKAANQSSTDQRIECDLDWKVLQLKEEISKTHPARPSVEEQRLIYSGQLLQDSLLLRSILRHPSDSNEYTIHMVCPSMKPSPNVKCPQDQPTCYSPPVVSNEPNSHNEIMSESNGDGLRHRFTSEQLPTIGVQQQGFDTSSLYSSFPQLPTPFQGMGDPIQQMAAMQQMYAQYMASYMQYIQSGSLESGGFFQDISTSSAPISSISNETDNRDPQIQPQQSQPQTQQQQQNQQQEQQQQLPPVNDVDPQRNAQPRLNQLGGEGEEEEMMARDWLDYIYYGSRMVVLLSIVYFYSTLTRFLIVTFSAFMIYLYQCGCFRLWRIENHEPQQQQPPQPERQNNQQQQQQEEEERGPSNEGEGSAGSRQGDPAALTEGEEDARPQQPSAQPSPEDEEPRGAADNATSRETLQQQQQRRRQREVEGEREGEMLLLEEEEVEEGALQNAPSTAPSSPNRPAGLDGGLSPPQQHSLPSLMWTFVTTLFTSLLPDQQQQQIL